MLNRTWLANFTTRLRRRGTLKTNYTWSLSSFWYLVCRFSLCLKHLSSVIQIIITGIIWRKNLLVYFARCLVTFINLSTPPASSNDLKQNPLSTLLSQVDDRHIDIHIALMSLFFLLSILFSRLHILIVPYFRFCHACHFSSSIIRKCVIGQFVC